MSKQRRPRRKRKGVRVNTWGCNNGEFQSLINGRPVAWAGTIARDLLFILEFEHDSIAWYREQPFTLLAQFEDGTARRYKPDCLVAYKDSSMLLIECKPEARLEKAHTRRQIAIGKAWADATGHTFTVVTDADLRGGPKLANLKLLFRYARLQVLQRDKNACIECLRQHPQGITFFTLTTQLYQVYVSENEAANAQAGACSTGGEGTDQAISATNQEQKDQYQEGEQSEPFPTTAPALLCSPIVYSLLFQHVILTDLDQPLTPQSLVWLPSYEARERGQVDAIHPRLNELVTHTGAAKQ